PGRPLPRDGQQRQDCPSVGHRVVGRGARLLLGGRSAAHRRRLPRRLPHGRGRQQRVRRHLGRGLTMIVFKPDNERITCLAFSPDGQLLARYGYDKTVRLWEQDGDAMREVRTFPGDVTAGPVAFSTDGRYLASGGLRIAVWDLERPEEKPLFAHQVLAASI